MKVGDVISIRFGEKAVEAKVLSVQETVRKDEAAELFQYL
ncbi:ribosomal 50S subunit-recycling heat shock protein [Oribacterium sinus]|uniref:Ribosomal 50S subunit-recycling heat shock protein n=1 Tax=Oribacterium sinus TaxID=237576 RepID=A0A7W9W0R2_9FIRM|nr:ribosomal 50S subunit-recycling heat shock protein [Oribacterium sinus]